MAVGQEIFVKRDSEAADYGSMRDDQQGGMAPPRPGHRVVDRLAHIDKHFIAGQLRTQRARVQKQAAKV